MSYGLNIVSSSYDVDKIRTASFIEDQEISLTYRDDIWTTTLVPYPAYWDRGRDFAIPTEVKDEDFSYYNINKYSFDSDGLRIMTRNGDPSNQFPGDNIGKLIVKWFYRVPPPTDYGLEAKNEDDDIIISSNYPVYILDSYGTISLDSNGFGIYPEEDSTKFVVINLVPGTGFIRIRGGIPGNETLTLAEISGSVNSVDYRVYKKIESQAAGYGLQVFNSLGEITYQNNADLAPVNGVFMINENIVTTDTLLDTSINKELWVSFQETEIRSSDTEYTIRSFGRVLERLSDGSLRQGVKIIIYTSSWGRVFSDAYDEMENYYNVFQ